MRDFFHIAGASDSPTNLATTSPLLFFTRFITHFCAPVFVFLAGTSAFLQASRKPKKELSVFLIKRGLWLVFAEMAIVTLGLTFDPTYHVFILQVIWAIGTSMIILGLLVRLPFPVILLYGLLIVFFITSPMCRKKCILARFHYGGDLFMAIFIFSSLVPMFLTGVQ